MLRSSERRDHLALRGPVIFSSFSFLFLHSVTRITGWASNNKTTMSALYWRGKGNWRTMAWERDSKEKRNFTLERTTHLWRSLIFVWGAKTTFAASRRSQRPLIVIWLYSAHLVWWKQAVFPNHRGRCWVTMMSYTTSSAVKGCWHTVIVHTFYLLALGAVLPFVLMEDQRQGDYTASNDTQCGAAVWHLSFYF